MSGFDQPPIFFTDSFNDIHSLTNDISHRSELLSRFKRFIKEFQTLTYEFCYRDTLKKNFNLGENHLTINLDHLSTYDSELCERMINRPNEHLPLFEIAAENLIRELALISNNNNNVCTKIQIILKSSATPISLRSLKSDMVSKLVKIPGVVINASSIRSKALKITLQCRSCQTTIPNIHLEQGLDGYALPRKCPSNQPGSMMANSVKMQCPLDPFFVVPDKCECVDFQILKLQELPESSPTGEIPRNVTLYCDRYLVDKVTPGTRIMVTGIYCIKKFSSNKSKKSEGSSMETGIRKPYIRVVGIEMIKSELGSLIKTTLNSFNLLTRGNSMFTVDEENIFRKFSSKPNVYEIIAKNIAPSIYGSEDIKKSIACLLFGGSRKRLPDGLIRRGDINMLLLGDPGTAKSQLLKFVEKVAPLAYYTSGKGSSAAGLTASLNRDSNSRGFVIEGGAMVLADGGIVCIDEFDKMREDDRVAIHEAMEQQTISIAKAGITTKLNSRCAVLAAANSVFGRWDNSKGDKNIEFMPTILSRFDMIYIVKDEHNAQRDMQLASHVLQIHIDSGIGRPHRGRGSEQPNIYKDELSLEFLTRYIAYCKQNCAPRLTPLAAEKLKHCYVQLRNRSREMEQHLTKKASITITVRQLEAIVRISESLAKMSLKNFATEEHVEEAIRLFKVSTLEAASSGSLTGAEGFLANEDMEEIRQIEKQIKQRFAIGTQVTEQRIIQDLMKQKFSENSIQNVLNIMVRRGELQYRLQRKIIYRLR